MANGKSVYQDVIDALQHPHRDVRMQAAAALGKLIGDGKITREETSEVNNHVHTTYSFSPYEPAMAAYKAWQAGLQIVGCVDHDSISGGEEMCRSAASIGIASTIGYELRTSFHDTPLADRKINSPDAKGIGYVVVHGVPADRIGEVKKMLEPVQRARNTRNRRQVASLNSLLKGTGIGQLSFERDVKAISHSIEGGSITERHILAALSRRIMSRFGRGRAVLQKLENSFGITLKGMSLSYIGDPGNSHYLYDLLGVLKANLLPRFYIQPEQDEILPVRDVVGFAREIGAIPAYPYLGDVTESPTGDKKAEEFEDSYLDELFEVLQDIGFPAVTYMPPRNTLEQIQRIQQFCQRYSMMEISGVDINSSRQTFRCPELLESACMHLVDSAWALVAHEKLLAQDRTWGFFAPDNPLADVPLEKRLKGYSRVGRAMDHHHPDRVMDCIEEIYHE